MVKGTYILSEDRETTLQMFTAIQVADAEFYTQVYENTPMIAKLMMDKFKEFMENDYFTALERQTVLIKFLECQNIVEIVQEVLKFVENCELKQDYEAIILEWLYHNSEDIIQTNLARVDGEFLCLSKEENKVILSGIGKPTEKEQAIMNNLTKLLKDAFKNSKFGDIDNGEEGTT